MPLYSSLLLSRFARMEGPSNESSVQARLRPRLSRSKRRTASEAIDSMPATDKHATGTRQRRRLKKPRRSRPAPSARQSDTHQIEEDKAVATSKPTQCMRRIVNLFEAGKFAPGDTLTYEIPTTSGKFRYAAKFQGDGRIIDAEEVTAPIKSKESDTIGEKKWDSPTDFVKAMYAYAESRLPPQHRRGYIIGWNECRFQGVRLYDIFCASTLEAIGARNDNPSGKSEEPNEFRNLSKLYSFLRNSGSAILTPHSKYTTAVPASVSLLLGSRRDVLT